MGRPPVLETDASGEGTATEKRYAVPLREDLGLEITNVIVPPWSFSCP